MLINKNRITDSSLVVHDLELYGSVESETSDMDITTVMKEGDSTCVSQSNGNTNSRFPLQDFSQSEELQKIKRLLKVLGASMALCGIFNLDLLSEKKYSKNQGEEKKSRSKKFQIHSVYCYVVLACLCAACIRSVLAFFVGDQAKKNFTFRVIVATWSLQLTLNALVMMKASHPRWGNLGAACQLWDRDVIRLMTNLHVGLNVRKIQRILSTIFVIAIVSMVFNVFLCPTFMFLYKSEFSTMLTDVLLAPFPENATSKTVACCLHVFMTVSWMVPVMYMVGLCFVVRSGFKVCKLALANTIARGKDTNTYPECLYRQRMLHLNLSRCLEVMDKDFKYMYAVTFFTNIPLACFILYHILKTEMDTLEICVISFWLGSNVVFVCLVTLFGATVNSAAHSPLDCIYDVGMKGITLEQLGQLNLFTSKLNGGSIGFTVMTFVPVTKELFLTVGGLYITYLFVLLQF